jgi:hypothetical protein
MPTKAVHYVLMIWLTTWASICGCRSDGAQPSSLFDSGNADKETWTIRCFQATGPQHTRLAAKLADVLRQDPGLDPQSVRLVSERDSTKVYYGRYKKKTSRETGDLEFPPAYRRDIATIRQIRVNGRPLFSLPTPELIGGTSPTNESIGTWDVRNAPGPYTLQIAVFYNTPTFHQRKKAAEQYVQLLRSEGFHAYFYHEQGRSFVFVGDFAESDIVQTPQGPRFGPRVEKLIAQREEEFRYMLENGHKVRHKAPTGRMVVPPSQLVRVPGSQPTQP